MKPIILASTSPRRKELLKKTGLQFEVVASNFEEDMNAAMDPCELAKWLSFGKAEAVARTRKNALVIAADTFIVLEGKLLGKPHTEARAKEMLKQLSGKVHLVITGFTIIDSEIGKSVSEAVQTKVFFKKLTAEDITRYVRSGEPLDKAGAYAIQGLGFALVEKIEGDYSNVVGFPVERVMTALKGFE